MEFKSVAGGLPKSLWETLSAFANTEGGWLVLGVAERNGGFEIEGLRNPQALLKAFWDNHNNAQKLSQPVCREQDVAVLPVGLSSVICLHVPRALRQQRPVFINGNPLTGTFKRNYKGDYRCPEPEVRRMLREASDEPLDARFWKASTWVIWMRGRLLHSAIALARASRTILFWRKTGRYFWKVWARGGATGFTRSKA